MFMIKAVIVDLMKMMATIATMPQGDQVVVIIVAVAVVDIVIVVIVYQLNRIHCSLRGKSDKIDVPLNLHGSKIPSARLLVNFFFLLAFLTFNSFYHQIHDIFALSSHAQVGSTGFKGKQANGSG